MDLPAGVQIKWVGRDDPETSEMSGEEAEVPVIQQMVTSGKIYKISCASNPSIRLLKDPKNVGVTQSGPRNYDLDHKVVMRLLQLYKQNRSKVGTHTVPSLKRLWEIFASDINQVFGTEYTASQIENKWRVLERKHKKVYDKSNRGGRVFRYRKEMDEIFPDKKNINLQVLRDTNREPVDEHQPPGGSNAGTLTTARNVRKGVKRRIGEEISGNDVLMMIREDKKQHYDHCAHIQEERLLLERERLQERTRKNDLTEQRNALLKEYLDANIRVPE